MDNDKIKYINPTPGPGQIWRSKDEYRDPDGVIRRGESFYIYITTPPKEIDNIEFVRVLPISEKVELFAEDEIVIKDKSILGFPFIIETWNEQPVSTGLLEKSISDIDIDLTEGVSFVELSDEQKKFRSKEIKNTAFLRESVLAHLFDEEESAFGDGGIKNIAFFRKNYMAIAATLLILFTSIYAIWQPGKLNNQELVALYAEHIPDQFGDEISIDGGTVRGEECAIENLTSAECKQIDKALALYRSNDYKNSRIIFEDVLQPLDKNPELAFYLGVSQLKSGSSEDAVTTFEYLLDNKNYSLTLEAQYYLALSYLQTGNRKAARSILKSVVGKDSKYSAQTKIILKKMRWF